MINEQIRYENEVDLMGTMAHLTHILLHLSSGRLECDQISDKS